MVADGLEMSINSRSGELMVDGDTSWMMLSFVWIYFKYLDLLQTKLSLLARNNGNMLMNQPLRPAKLSILPGPCAHSTCSHAPWPWSESIDGHGMGKGG